MIFSLTVAAAAFALIFPVEFPDKTFIATLVLATRYRPLLAWIGVSSAFLVQTVIAVTAGSLLSALPKTPVTVASALLFLIGGFVLLRGASKAAEEGQEAGDHGHQGQDRGHDRQSSKRRRHRTSIPRNPRAAAAPRST